MIEVNFTPESYSEYMNLDVEYVKENWESIHERLMEEMNEIFNY